MLTPRPRGKPSGGLSQWVFPPSPFLQAEAISCRFVSCKAHAPQSPSLFILHLSHSLFLTLSFKRFCFPSSGPAFSVDSLQWVKNFLMLSWFCCCWFLRRSLILWSNPHTSEGHLNATLIRLTWFRMTWRWGNAEPALVGNDGRDEKSPYVQCRTSFYIACFWHSFGCVCLGLGISSAFKRSSIYFCRSPLGLSCWLMACRHLR